MPTPAVTFANLYNFYNPCTYSVTGDGAITASLTGTSDGYADANLWLLVSISGTLSYTVTASSEGGYDGGRLYLTSSAPAAHGSNGGFNVATIAGLTNVSESVSGLGTSTGTVAVTAGQYLVLRYRKDGEESAYDNKITAALSITPDAVARTLYYNAAVDSDWNTLGNWWTTNTAGALSDPASALPTAIDDVILTGSVASNTGGAIEVSTLAMTTVAGGYVLGVDVTISGGGYNGIFTNSSIGAGVTVTGNCEFIGSQGLGVGAASNSGTITGNALFTGDVGVLPCVVAAPVENFGTVSGNAVFNGNSRNASTGTVTGTCAFNDNSYNDGTAVQASYAGFTGSTCAGGFVILGAPASGLDSEGRGTYAVDGLYYTAYPTLAEGYQYQTGVYYFAGVATVTLDASGNGYNTVDGIYYIGGVSASGYLDSAGTGFYDGHAYLNGTLNPNGWNSLHYYIADVETTLPESGTGIWETRNYVSGVSLGQPGTDKRWLVYTAGTGDPLDWHLSSNWLSYSTDWEGGAGDEAGAIPTAVDNVRINGACPKYDSSISATCDVLSVTTVGWFDLWESSAINCTTAVISGINRLVINAATSISVTEAGVNYGSLTGPTTFYNTASNAAEDHAGTWLKGICNSATTFRDTSSNSGVLSPDGTAYGYYHLAIVVGTASFRDSSTNVGWCGDAVFYDSAKNMLGIQGTSTLSYSKGINGTGILGIL